VRRHITVALAVAASLLLAAPAQAAPPASDPPGGLRVTGVTTTTVGLAWNAASGATGYQVLRGTPTTSLAVVASLGTSTTYTDTGRSPGTTYVYAVATVRKTKVSPPSATVTVTTLPAAPTGVTATALSWDRVQVRWSASSGATSYEVRRDGLLTATVGQSTSPNYLDAGLTESTQYRYTVRAVNGSGSSADSAAAVVTTPVRPKVWASMTFTGTPNPSVDGDLVSFRATLSGSSGVPSGTASLTIDGTTSTVSLNASGVATWPSVRLTTGSRYVTATYSGDVRYNADSRTILHEVMPAPTPPPPLFGSSQQYPTASDAEAVVTADVNGDGRDEAVVSSRTGNDPADSFSLYVHDFVPGQAGPTVTQVPTGNEYVDSEAAAAGDMDGDGFDDVAVGTDGGVKVFAGSAAGLTAPVLVPTAGEVRDLVVAEVTGDGSLDLVVALQLSSSTAVVEVLPGTGGLGFGPAERLALPHGLTPALSTGDLFGDAREEVVALWHDGLSYAVEVVADYGTADGGRGNWDTWAYRTIETGGWGADSVDTGDVSGDGFVDVVVTIGGNKPTSGLVVFRHGDSGGLLPQETWASYDIPEPVVVTDADLDGDADVVTVHGGWNQLGLYRQSGAGRIGPEELYAVPYASHYSHRGLAVGDVTGDGRPDALLADYNHGLVVLPGL
jgi:hypothetical protein